MVFEDYRKVKCYLLVNGYCIIFDLIEEFNWEWCVFFVNFFRNEIFGIGD